MFKWLKGKKKECVLFAPMTGKCLPMEAIPDQVFSSKMLGDGFAVAPIMGAALSPCAGTVTQIFPTNHAVGIVTEDGLELLLHIGIDTVELKGRGFTPMVKAGDHVTVGTPLVDVDLGILADSEKSLVTPLVITNMEKVESIALASEEEMVAGVTQMARIMLK